jgi:transposase
MAYIQGEGRNQGTLFPVLLDDLVPADHMCRVVDAFVEQLDMEKLGFGRAEPADTGSSALLINLSKWRLPMLHNALKQKTS